MFQIKLLALYFYVCEKYDKELKYACQRFSNNDQPEFTDQEVLTIYLYVVSEEELFKIKAIYHFAQRHLHCWFPKLPSYAAFNHRLNRLSAAMQRLSTELLAQSCPEDCSSAVSLVDSFPILTCSAKRQGKVAKEVTAKGYCSTKDMYYYGLKMHVVAWQRKAGLPHPESLVLSSAADNDLTVFKENCSGMEHRLFYGDKIYHNQPWFTHWYKEKQSEMLTPVKAIKGTPQVLRNFDKAADDLYSRAVSVIRQPIESLFNWLIEKTDIQTANKVRSTQGLLVHVFGKIAAAFIYCIFNP
ncbi:MAG: transposase [Flavisolibacter sp.]|nr:transposase [Flavisolibacter sp.]